MFWMVLWKCVFIQLRRTDKLALKARRALRYANCIINQNRAAIPITTKQCYSVWIMDSDTQRLAKGLVTGCAEQSVIIGTCMNFAKNQPKLCKI